MIKIICDRCNEESEHFSTEKINKNNVKTSYVCNKCGDITSFKHFVYSEKSQKKSITPQELDKKLLKNELLKARVKYMEELDVYIVQVFDFNKWIYVGTKNTLSTWEFEEDAELYIEDTKNLILVN